MGKRGQLTKYPVVLPVRVSEAMSGDLDFLAGMRHEPRAKTVRHLLEVGARAVKRDLVRRASHGTQAN